MPLISISQINIDNYASSFIIQHMKHKLKNSDVMIYDRCGAAFILNIYIANGSYQLYLDNFEEAKRY
jgi:hypothetical protein